MEPWDLTSTNAMSPSWDWVVPDISWYLSECAAVVKFLDELSCVRAVGRVIGEEVHLTVTSSLEAN